MERSTVGAILRSTQAYCLQLCEKETLDWGIAYYSEKYPHVPDTNQFREVTIDDPAQVAGVIDEVERWFSDRHLECFCWAPASGEGARELQDQLTSRGFKRCELTAMRLVRWVQIADAQDVRVIPARAVRGAFRRSCDRTRTGSQFEDACLDTAAYEERLDDPSFDMFVALIGSEPAGRCALYQVGDIARVMDLTVLPEFTQHAVDLTLLAHVLAIAQRLQMAVICAQVAREDQLTMARLESVGFSADGEIIEYHRTSARETGGAS